MGYNISYRGEGVKKLFRLIAARIVYHRKLKNMTQLDLAVAAQISEDYVSLIENGKAPGLTIATGMKIAEALDVSFEELVKRN